MTTATLSIPQIHCISCEALIKLSLKKLSGITSSQINFRAKTATVAFDEKIISKEKIQQQIQKDTGYKVS